MTTLTDLETAKAALTATIATLYASPKPTYSIDGQNVSWSEYRKSLYDELKELNKLILFETRNESTAKPTSVDYDPQWRDGYSRSGLLDDDVSSDVTVNPDGGFS